MLCKAQLGLVPKYLQVMSQLRDRMQRALLIEAGGDLKPVSLSWKEELLGVTEGSVM